MLVHPSMTVFILQVARMFEAAMLPSELSTLHHIDFFSREAPVRLALSSTLCLYVGLRVAS